MSFPLRFGYKLIVYQYLIIYLLQASAMLADDRTFIIVVNVYDGLIKGGLLLISAELTAELAYPLGESLSLGFLNAL